MHPDRATPDIDDDKLEGGMLQLWNAVMAVELPSSGVHVGKRSGTSWTRCPRTRTTS